MKQERQPKTVVYLSGRITGLPMTYVRALFQQAEEHFTSEGYKVLTPLRNGLTEDDSWEKHMAKDIIMLQRADIIALLPGWVKSRGARLEYEIAKEMNITPTPYIPASLPLIGTEITTLPEYADPKFRYKIAGFENLTPQLIDTLSRDEDGEVRLEIANRDNLTAEQIERLSKDKDEYVRWVIATRPDLTAEQIDRLSQDENRRVRETITSNIIAKQRTK